MPKTIFLGGTASNSTWRETLIPLLDSAKISFYNPIVENWTPQAQQEEIHQRATSDFLLYTITSQLEGFYSIAEAVEDSNKKPTRTIFCYLPEGFTPHQLKSLEATARLVEENSARVCGSLEAVAEYVNGEEVESQIEISPKCQIF